jgi:hypothetical protein
MKTKLYAVAAFLAAAVFVNAQDASTRAADTTALLANKAYFDAKLGALQAEEKVQAQLDSAATAQKAADKAAQDAKEKAQLDTLKAIGDLAAKMPTGSYTSSDGGVATPKSMELAFRNLDQASAALYLKLAPAVSGKTLVFVDAIPGPKASFELLFYHNLMKQIGKDAAALGVTVGQAEIAAAAIIPAIPAIVSAVSGFFKVDYTEKVFDAKLSNGMAVTSLIEKLQPNVSGAVYLGLEAFAFGKVTSLEATDLFDKLATVGEIDAKLAIEIENADTRKLEKDFAEATNAVAGTKAEITLLETRNELLDVLAKASPQNAPAYTAESKDLVARLVTLNSTLVTQNTTLADAKAALAVPKAKKEKQVALRERIAKLFTDLRSTEGSPPLFVRLIRDEQLKKPGAEAENIRFVTLSVAASPQGTITKKSFWGQSTKASALVALEYRVADGNSKIVAAGILPYYRMEEVKLTEPQAGTN